MRKEITFDSFARGALWVAGALTVIWMLNRLSGVLLPFFVAWFLAYMLYPLVVFFQYRLHVKSRTAAIAATFTVVLAVVAGSLLLVVPPTINEVNKLRGVALEYLSGISLGSHVMPTLRAYLEQYLDGNSWLTILQHGGVMECLRAMMEELWNLLSGTFDFAASLFSAFVCVLYTVFILFDYEKLSQGWIKMLPRNSRRMCLSIARDVEQGMNAYFRGQAIVALCVGILFAIGFLIIGFPMAIVLGLFIGLLNLVPYLQLIGFVPTILLALVESANTGRNFWVVLALALLVFLVVQTIQDLILVPRIMGKAMGLKPAIILLSLSVWGSLLGFIGLIIALPLTTLLISYYRQIIAHYDQKTEYAAADAGSVPDGQCPVE